MERGLLSGACVMLRLLVLAFFVCTSAACSDGDDGRTNYSLKVVVQPRGSSPSSSCAPLGNGSPSTVGTSLPDDLWLETRAHTLHGSTWYDVRLLRGSTRAVLGGWRHDAQMAREGYELRTYVEDARGEYTVRITGSFDRDDPCVP
jgi:hypothetical protein